MRKTLLKHLRRLYLSCRLMAGMRLDDLRQTGCSTFLKMGIAGLVFTFVIVYCVFTLSNLNGGGYPTSPSFQNNGEDNTKYEKAVADEDIEDIQIINTITTDTVIIQKKKILKSSQDVDDPEPFIKQLDELTNGSDEKRAKALKLCEINYPKLKKNTEFLWRFSRLVSLKSEMFDDVDDKDLKKELCLKSEKLAKSALDLAGHNANGNIHKWYGIASGSTTKFVSITEKVRIGAVFKGEIETALKKMPTDASLHYFLGRYCYKVYMLSWFEKTAAKTLFGSAPTATIKETLDHFLKAVNLRNEDLREEVDKSKEICLYIAKCYIEMSQNKEAVTYLKKADALPNKEHGDIKVQDEVKKLLYKYS